MEDERRPTVLPRCLLGRTVRLTERDGLHEDERAEHVVVSAVRDMEARDDRAAPAEWARRERVSVDDQSVRQRDLADRHRCYAGRAGRLDTDPWRRRC